MVANATEAPGAVRHVRQDDPARTIFSLLLFGLLPLLLVCEFTIALVGHRFAFDFRTFWEAARAVTSGHSPYPSPDTIAHAHSATGDYEYFVYPPPFVIALLPFAALPFAVASGLYTAALLVCVAAVLGLLEVRDWRCYGVAFATIPVLSALRLGTVTPLLMLLAAAAWRYRNHWAKCGAAVACATLLKLFLWPLVLWLLLTRRWKAAAAAAGGAAVTTALAWAALGFKGLGDYPALLRNLSRVEAGRSYSLVAVADRLHLPDPQLTWLLLAVPIALALAGTCLTSMQSADSDRRVFATMIGIALLLTPILWLNYFALLIVPVALRQKRLGLDWALLAAFWVSPLATPAAHPLWRLAVVLTLLLLIVERARRPLREPVLGARLASIDPSG
jgi:alpha-1,2-mannosyltransferase